MTEDQKAELVNKYGEVNIKQHSGTVSSADEVLEIGADCDVLAVVLPPAILAGLTNPKKNQKPVIRSVMNRVATGKTIINPNGNSEPEMAMVHMYWERVIKIEVVAERL